MRLPPPFRQLWSLWLAFSHALGRVMSVVLLTVLWVTVIGAYGICYKVIMLFRRRRESSSLWVPIPEQGPEDLLQQF